MRKIIPVVTFVIALLTFCACGDNENARKEAERKVVQFEQLCDRRAEIFVRIENGDTVGLIAEAEKLDVQMDSVFPQITGMIAEKEMSLQQAKRVQKAAEKANLGVFSKVMEKLTEDNTLFPEK